MRTLSLFILIGISQLSILTFSQDKLNTDSIKDGPYVFYVNDSLKSLRIENGILHEFYISPENYNLQNSTQNLPCDISDLLAVFSVKSDYAQKFTEVDSIVAISDVHGQYNVYIKHLQANGIIDENLNWKFGKGHFVFLGDAFDRGNQVTEILWHLFKLEKQAAKAGGMVHLILGNHESMVFDNDLRYIHEKYAKVEEIAGKSYTELYSENSILGKWLRCQPIMITINDILFVHAGASIDLVRMKLDAKEVNKLFNSNIYGKAVALPVDNKKIDLLTGEEGPLWYRGYFEDKTFDEIKIDSILNFYNVKHVLVGHTTSKRIKSKFNLKIIGIDAGIGYGYDGELLYYINNEFYKGSNTGRRTKL